MEAATAKMKYPPVKNFYDGEFVESGASDSLDVTSPLDGNLLSKVPMSTSGELDAAVASAKNAAASRTDPSARQHRISSARLALRLTRCRQTTAAM